MKLTLTSRALIAVAMGATIYIPVAAHAADSGSAGARVPAVAARPDKSIAAFEGKQLDLSKSWGDAKACYVDEEGARCFRSEAQLDNDLRARGLGANSRAVEPNGIRGLLAANAATCSTSVRLYSNSWYSGYVLIIGYKYQWANLSWFGFNNITSSYTMGSCYGTFRSGNYGGGSTYYGGSTSAWGQDGYMGSWSNVLSSLYLV